MTLLGLLAEDGSVGTGEVAAYAIDALDGFIERPWCGDVFDDGEGELVGVLRMRFAHAVGTGFGSDGPANLVAMLEELLDDVSCHEAGRSGH